MSITVQEMMLKLVNRIDPQGRDPANPTNPPVYFDATNIGVFNGKFSAQRQLDIYNEARYELLRALQFTIPKDKLSVLAEGPVKVASPSSSAGAVALPSDYFAIANIECDSFDIFLVPITMYRAIRKGKNPYRKESANVVFVCPQGRQLVSPNGATNFTNGTAVNIAYYSLSSFALTDVTNGTSVESLDDIYMTPLLEIAEAISLELGRVELNRVVQLQIAGIH